MSTQFQFWLNKIMSCRKGHLSPFSFKLVFKTNWFFFFFFRQLQITRPPYTDYSKCHQWRYVTHLQDTVNMSTQYCSDFRNVTTLVEQTRQWDLEQCDKISNDKGHYLHTHYKWCNYTILFYDMVTARFNGTLPASITAANFWHFCEECLLSLVKYLYRNVHLDFAGLEFMMCYRPSTEKTTLYIKQN